MPSPRPPTPPTLHPLLCSPLPAAMTSKAEASFAFMSLGSNLLPTAAPKVGVVTTLKKKLDDATLSLTFTEASLRDPKAASGIVVSAEKPLGGEGRPGG